MEVSERDAGAIRLDEVKITLFGRQGTIEILSYDAGSFGTNGGPGWGWTVRKKSA